MIFSNFDVVFASFDAILRSFKKRIQDTEFSRQNEECRRSVFATLQRDRAAEQILSFFA